MCVKECFGSGSLVMTHNIYLELILASAIIDDQPIHTVTK